MWNRTNAVVASSELPMRKLIVAMMAAAIIAIFLTSFLARLGMQAERQPKSKQSKQIAEMAEVPAFMAKLKENPADVEALLGLAEIFSRAEDWQRALHFWSKALELDPSNLETRYHRGFTLLQLKRFEEAVSDYEYILQANNESYQAHYYLGEIYRHELNKPNVAKNHFQQALDLKPHDQELVTAIKNELSELN